MLSPILLKFFLGDPLTIRISNFGFFFKKKFFKIFPFFPNARGPPKNFDVQNFKFFGKKFQKQLYWVLANTKRNKVMNFDEPSPRSVDAANGFIVERVKKTPPRWNRVKVRNRYFHSTCMSLCLDTLHSGQLSLGRRSVSI